MKRERSAVDERGDVKVVVVVVVLKELLADEGVAVVVVVVVVAVAVRSGGVDGTHGGEGDDVDDDAHDNVLDEDDERLRDLRIPCKVR